MLGDMGEPKTTEPNTGPDVNPGELAAQLGLPRSTFMRAIETGKIPAPSSLTPGGHRRWTRAEAASIVRAAGRTVPKAWEVARPATSAGGEGA